MRVSKPFESAADASSGPGSPGASASSAAASSDSPAGAEGLRGRPSPIQAVVSERLYRKIARQLSDLISSGAFTAGQRLPPERELARQLGVSRPSVREALIALEIQGKVEVRVGSGIFVTGPDATPDPTPVQEGEGPFELLRARSLIEGETAAVAAKLATREELVEIKAALEEMRRGLRLEKDNDASDRAFHLAIAAATHNSALVSVVQGLWDQGRGAMFRRMEQHFQTPGLRTANFQDHRAVLSAIQAGDARRARTAMHEHLTRVEKEFTRGWDLLRDLSEKGSRIGKKRRG